MNSDISGKIDTSKWMNQANIVTPNFKRSAILLTTDSSFKPQKYLNTSAKKVAIDAVKEAPKGPKEESLEQLDSKDKDFSCKRNLKENFELLLEDG
mmetsp:Transcript_3770/g.3691  ORF Transcript_3770/g.3691 Transcript_3770/m.3691 type:complete len:96 (+) Transcript_3770:1440-1727(+)